jgi:transcriptional regulator with XRE-family HTH domain
MLTYNEAMRAARINAGLTQNEVAEALHVARPIVSKFESGVGSAPSISRLIELADLYKISIDELVGRKK